MALRNHSVDPQRDCSDTADGKETFVLVKYSVDPNSKLSVASGTLSVAIDSIVQDTPN